MNAMQNLHGELVFNRRVRVLSRHLASQLPYNARVLDIGCGSGDIASAIMALRPDVTIEGVDVLVRPGTKIPVRAYDGRTLPYEADSFDACILVDVLHHTDDPAVVLEEAKRVARHSVLIKDHFRDGPFAATTLRFMDWVGNAPHGVRLPYNYLAKREWLSLWRTIQLTPAEIISKLSLYPGPFSWLFDRNLHFVSRLDKALPPAE